MERQRDYTAANTRAKRLRREPTLAEKRLWSMLRKLEGFHFRRQVPLGEFTYDFGDHGLKLLIEVDGGVHLLPEVAERDARKEDWATGQGYRIVRVPNSYVFGTGEPAIAMVLSAARTCVRERG